MTLGEEPRTSEEPEESTRELPPEGWFADPEWPGWLRWWDGERWTEHRTRDPAHVPSNIASRGTTAWAVVSVVCGAVGLFPVAIAAGMIARQRIQSSNGRLGGEGMANTGIVLGVIGALVTLGFVLTTRSHHHHNARSYRGADRQVALVVDTFARDLDRNQGDAVCADLLTAQFAQKVEHGTGKSCSDAVVDAVAKGAYQAEIDVKSIDIVDGVATLQVTEGGDPEVWKMIRQDGVWRIDAIRAL